MLPSRAKSGRQSDGSLTDAEDIFIMINNEEEPEFVAIEPPRALINNESFEKEKQISVDPVSLKGSMLRQASFRLVSPAKNINNSMVPLPPSKLKFVSGSLASSASPSPQKTSNLLKKIWKSQNNNNHVSSAMDDTHLAMREASRRRSRSMDERRSSFTTDDFDLLANIKPKIRINHQPQQQQQQQQQIQSKPPLGPSGEDRMKKTKSRDNQRNSDQDGFKCGKLCLFIPRGKGKPVRSTSTTSASAVMQVSVVSEGQVISRRASLEKFECWSWSSNEASSESTSLFFDLPLELIRCSVSDMQSPVTAAFVFDNESDGQGETSQQVNRRDDFQVYLEVLSA